MSSREPKVSEQVKKILHNFLNEQLEKRKFVPRMADILLHLQMKRVRFKPAEVRKYVKQKYSLYGKTIGPSKNVKARLRLIRESLGTVGVDILFLRRLIAGHTPLIYAYLVGVDIASNLTLATPIYRKKDARALINAFQRIMTEYLKKTKQQIHTVTSDKEGAILSAAFTSFLKEHAIRRYVTKTAVKVGAVEGKNRTIRQLFFALKARHVNLSEQEIVQECIKIINNRKIRFRSGTFSSFSPNEVTKRTFRKFQLELFEAEPTYFFSLTPINPVHLQNIFKYEVNEKVRVFRKYLQLPNISSKFSTQAVSEDVFKILKRNVFFTASGMNPIYLIVNTQKEKASPFTMYEEGLTVA